jgi:alcohol dehydrogenase
VNTDISIMHEVCLPRTTIGLGAVSKIAELIKILGGKNVTIITDQVISKAKLFEKVHNSLTDAGIEYFLFDLCEPNAPYDTVKLCVDKLLKTNSDIVVGIGGGSVMDTSKLASLWVNTGKDIRGFVGLNKVEPHQYEIKRILIPTTAGSGSEWSQNAVFLDRETGIKSSMSSSHIMADRIIIDPEMMAELPPLITGETGVDALSHALEAYTTIKATLVSDMFAEKVIQLVVDNLPAAYASGGQNMTARYNMALAAALGLAAAMSTGGGGVLVHGMAYPLRDFAPIPVSHGTSVSVLMPHAMRFQMISNLPRFARIAELMGEKTNGLSLQEAAPKSADAVQKLSELVGVPQRMRDLKIKKDDIPRLVDSMFELRTFHAEASCRPASRDDVRAIYEAAW